MPSMTGGRFIAEMAHGYGITHAFFMPYIGPRALMEMEKLGIKRVQTHGEKAAAYMADAYARTKRAPGLCMAQAVGALNLAAGLQDAYLACSPVVALTGRELLINQQRHAYQEVDHVNPFSAVSKYSAYVSTPEHLPVYLRQAFRAATTGTPGPVHLDFEGIAGQGVVEPEADLEIVVEEAFSRLPPFRPEAELSTIDAALQLLDRAQSPVIVAGGGVVASDARNELIELAEKLAIPVATSLNAKNMFPSDHNLAVGVPGSYSRACSNQLMFEADLVFFIGSHAGGQVTNAYQIPPQGTPIIQLDINPEEIGRNYPVQVGLQGDVKSSLRRMIDRAAPSNTRTDWLSRVQELVQQWNEDVSHLVNSDILPMRPERLCRELSDYLPSDAILVSDTGHAGIWTGTMLDLKHADQSYLRCSGSLGWGLPAAMGAKCAQPDRPVLCFTGDGGIWYHIAELETAVRCGINTVTVVNNNHSLNQEQGGVEQTYGGRTAGSDELWLFEDADFARIAESFGALGITVNKPGELPGALDRAFASGRPAVVDVKTHVEGIAPRAWMPAS
ncbi:MAG: thiamine pyrophosphate-binding protein [Caldilineaceae bacterium SB0668_bin_21]|nr:thiamine pyrophosphate-binding protein [Caldilineaceae bacterium SB0668_bin_21]MYC23159.1 thiamine pyrophosphate-binding protein [Caldilineaceae bacterium SB0662_bin_25]